MADDTDTSSPVAPIEVPAVQLDATSYNFQTLESGIEHALGLKTENGANKALATALTPLTETTSNVDIAVPEGCELKEVELEDGTTATIPVAIVADNATTTASA